MHFIDVLCILSMIFLVNKFNKPSFEMSNRKQVELNQLHYENNCPKTIIHH